MWFAWKYKVAYNYALEPLRKPPDSRRVFRAAMKLLAALALLSFLRDKPYKDYDMIFDPSWTPDSTFMSFYSQQQDQLCMTIEQHKGMAQRASCVACHQTHSVMLMLNTGSTKASTPYKGDFISYTKKTGAKITGIASKLEAKGEGLVKYHIKMDDGTDIAIHTMANHVPDLKF